MSQFLAGIILKSFLFPVYLSDLGDFFFKASISDPENTNVTLKYISRFCLGVLTVILGNSGPLSCYTHCMHSTTYGALWLGSKHEKLRQTFQNIHVFWILVEFVGKQRFSPTSIAKSWENGSRLSNYEKEVSNAISRCCKMSGVLLHKPHLLFSFGSSKTFSELKSGVYLIVFFSSLRRFSKTQMKTINVAYAKVRLTVYNIYL